MFVRRGEEMQVKKLLGRLRRKVAMKTRRPWFDLQLKNYIPDNNGLVETVEDLQHALEHFHCRLSVQEGELLFRVFPLNGPRGGRAFNWKAFADKLFPTDNVT